MPDRSSKKNRPGDVNQVAKSIVDEATSEETDEQPEETPQTDEGKNPAAVALGRLGGLKGGKARAKNLTKEQRSKIDPRDAGRRHRPPVENQRYRRFARKSGKPFKLTHYRELPFDDQRGCSLVECWTNGRRNPLQPRHHPPCGDSACRRRRVLVRLTQAPPALKLSGVWGGPEPSVPRGFASLPQFPGPAGLIDAELDEPGVFDFGDVGGAAVGAAEADVAGA